MSKYRTIQDAIRALPKDHAEQMAMLETQLAKARNLAKQQARTRYKAGAAVLGGAAAAGGRKLLRSITGD